MSFRIERKTETENRVRDLLCIDPTPAPRESSWKIFDLNFLNTRSKVICKKITVGISKQCLEIHHLEVVEDQIWDGDLQDSNQYDGGPSIRKHVVGFGMGGGGMSGGMMEEAQGGRWEEITTVWVVAEWRKFLGGIPFGNTTSIRKQHRRRYG